MTEIMTGEATQAQIGAYLVSLQFQPVPSHVLISSAKALRGLAKSNEQQTRKFLTTQLVPTNKRVFFWILSVLEETLGTLSMPPQLLPSYWLLVEFLVRSTATDHLRVSVEVQT